MGRVWSQPWITTATKSAKNGPVWRCLIKTFIWSAKIEYRTRSPVDKVDRGDEGIKPVSRRHRGLVKKSDSSFDDVPVFSFSDSVLFGGVGASKLMGNAISGEKGTHIAIDEFTAIIRPKYFDLVGELFFHK